MSVKKASKKATAKSATATPKALPNTTPVPEGMKKLGGGYADSWRPDTIGESLSGEVTGEVREVEFKQGRKTVQRRVMEVTTDDDERFAVWESAALGELFDAVAKNGIGDIIFLRYDGEGRKKPGQNPPKLFTVAIAE